MTPGCTVESCGFRDKYDDFDKLDTVIIGISCDTLEDQQKFTDKEKLSFPLYADTTKEVTKSYGVLNADRGLPNRVTFVIDKEGVVRKVYTKVTPKDHPEEVMKYVKENLAK
jgi:peroxiredoxin Q/BCP